MDAREFVNDLIPFVTETIKNKHGSINLKNSAQQKKWAKTKTYPIEWKKTFVFSMSNKGSISRIHKLLTKKKNTSTEC